MHGQKRIASQRGCSHLSGDFLFVCAVGQVYVPSIFELSEYCRSVNHRMCPFFLRQANEIIDKEMHDTGHVL